MKEKIFYFSIAGFILGIFLRSFCFINSAFASFLAFLALIIFLIAKFGVKDGSKKIILVSVAIFAFSLGILRYEIKDEVALSNKIDDFVGERIIANGIITEEPDVRENSTRLTTTLNNLKDVKGLEKKTNAKILITTEIYSKYSYGDKIKITGILKKPENFDTGNGRNFDYISYLAKEEIYYQIFQPKIEVISQGNGNFVKEGLFFIKNKFIKSIQNSIGEPQSALLGGLILGAKQSLSKDLQDEFRRAGIIHIVVLSGYNITIVAESIMRILSFLPRIFSMSLGALGIILFTIMVGGGATVIRASLMALIVILARTSGRNYDITRALLIAGILMLLQNPKILVFDPSFQLSFVSTLGLIWLSPIIEKKLHFVTEKFQLRELVVSTVSTQIFVLPLLLYMTGQFSVVSLIVNFLVLVFIPATMFFGFVAGIFGIISYIIAFPFAYITSALLSYELAVVHFWSSLPFASLEIPYFTWWMVLGIYLIYGVILWKIYRPAL